MRQSPDTSDKFRRLFNEHHRAIFQYCNRRLSVADANDAVAETFTVAWRKMDQLPTSGEIRPWLFGVARNVVKNAHRSERRQKRLRGKVGAVSDLPPNEPDTIVVRREDERAATLALATLKDSDQEILRLRTWEDLSVSEVAVVLNITVQAADMRTKRAIGRLGKALLAAGYEADTVPRGITKGEAS